jgi:RNA polymerase sigma-70 factor, ECF subfamily
MLGSVADGEDIVQEAFIRWMRADRSEMREPPSFNVRSIRWSAPQLPGD